MKVSRIALVVGAVAGVWLAGPGTVAAQLVLTGLMNYSTDGSGAVAGSDAWNTRGGDGIFNLYVTAPAGSNGDPFINSNMGVADGPTTSINVPLTAGTSQFFLFGEPKTGGPTSTFYGLNLFFNDGTSPGISVFAPLNASSFGADSSPTTLALDGSTTPGAGTLSFTDGGFTATLTAYNWSAPGVNPFDRVSAMNDVPSGTQDFVGSFTLQVSPVPEPGSLLLGGFGLLLPVAYRTCRRRRAGGTGNGGA